MMPGTNPRIIVHAGFHKTGTTSLQAALRLHARTLAPWFAVQTRPSSPALLAACEAVRAFSADPAGQAAALPRALADWAAATAAELSPGQGLLVSSEDLSGHMPGRHGIADYRAILPVAAALRDAVARHLPQLPLSLLFTTREPEGWLRSIHWQLSKHDDLVLGATRFARRHAGAAEFTPLLARLRAQVPGVPVLQAELGALAGRRLGPVEAIYDAALLPDGFRASLPVGPRSNSAPPLDLARAFVKLNRSDLPRPEVRRIKRDMLGAAGLLADD